MQYAITFFLFCLVLVLVVWCILIDRRNTVLIETMKDIQSITQGRTVPLQIPRIIHQTLPNKNTIHPKLQQNIDYIKRLNPTWEYRLYDDDDIRAYIKKHYPEYVDVYNRINPKYGAARADLFRYLLMYREGGVYLDLKSAMMYPLDKLIYPDDTYVVSYWEKPKHKKILKSQLGEIQQWYIICAPNLPAMKAVIERVVANIYRYSVEEFGIGRMGTLKTTGPLAYSDALQPYLPTMRVMRSNRQVGVECLKVKKRAHVHFIGGTHYTILKEPIIL